MRDDRCIPDFRKTDINAMTGLIRGPARICISRMWTADSGAIPAGPGLVRAGYGADLVAFDEQIKPRLPTVEPGLPGVLKGRLAS